MFETTIKNAAEGIMFGGYDFAHSGGYNNDGSLVVRADTQEHLDLMVADVAAGTVPGLPTPAPSDEDVLLAELAAQVIELQLQLAALQGGGA